MCSGRTDAGLRGCLGLKQGDLEASLKQKLIALADLLAIHKGAVGAAVRSVHDRPLLRDAPKIVEEDNSATLNVAILANKLETSTGRHGRTCVPCSAVG